MNNLSYRGLAWVAAMALFMQGLDATILNTSLPAISQDLQESPLEMQMAVISYSLAVALVMPLTAWLASKYGILTIFRMAVFLFSLGSLACACSTNLNVLILSRVLQGIGGALMTPVARLAIMQNVPKNQLLNALNLMATTGLVGPVVGPILGGWLVTNLSWHWIFLINLPIGIIGIFAAGMVMENSKGKQEHLDWKGFLLFAGGLVGLTLGLDLLGESEQAKQMVYTILSCGFSLLVLYYLYARKNENALFPLSLYQIRTFRIGILANIFIRLSGSGIPFLLPLMFQLVFGYSADVSGWLLTPIALSSIFVKLVSRQLLRRFGYKTILISCSLMMGVTIALMSLLNDQTPIYWLIINLVLYGSTMSMIFTAVNTLSLADLEGEQVGSGSTMLSIVQQLGIGLGIAVASVVLSFFHHTSGVQLQQAFSYTFLTSISFALVLIWVLTYLKASDGNNL